MAADTTPALLHVENLTTTLTTGRGPAAAVDDVGLLLHSRETVGVVGESGCGKTMLALSILRLVPDPPGRITGGHIRFKGRDLLELGEKQMRAVRGNEISMIFQEPMTSLNPVFTVGEQIAEALRLHQGLSTAAALEEAAGLLGLVGLPNPKRHVGSYPHELSGGMRQRVIIAMALACDPDLILADEPTTALDVTIQAQILDLMLELQEKKGAAILLITHDLGVVAQTCERVLVMYTGQVVESASVYGLYNDPLHPYTQGLLRSLPRMEGMGERMELTPISGSVPGLWDLPSGCRFHPRCPRVFDRCPREAPPLIAMPDGRQVRCLLYD